MKLLVNGNQMRFPGVLLKRRAWLLAVSGVAAVGMMACGSGGGASDSRFPIEVTDERVEVGARVYAANCASCHGDASTPPPLPGAPPHTDEGHTWHHADRLLFEWVMDRPPLAEVMPAFRGVLTEEEALAAIAYLKTFWPDDTREFQREGSEQYEEQIELREP